MKARRDRSPAHLALVLGLGQLSEHPLPDVGSRLPIPCCCATRGQPPLALGVFLVAARTRTGARGTRIAVRRFWLRGVAVDLACARIAGHIAVPDTLRRRRR